MQTNLDDVHNKTVFIGFHKNVDCELPRNSESIKYVPISSENLSIGGYDAYVRETDYENNIAPYNPMLNELTHIFCIGKNLELIEEKIGKIDFIGFEHYRRHFSKDLISSVRNPNDLLFVDSGQKVKSGVLRQYSEIPRPTQAQEIQALANLCDWTISTKMMQHDLVHEFLSSNIFFRCNMFVMHRSVFLDYFSFMEKVILHLIDEINAGKFSGLRPREPGFVGERISGLYFYSLMKSGRFNIQTEYLEL